MKLSFSLIMLALMLAQPILAQSDWQTVNAANITFEYRVTQDSQELEGRLTAQTTGWVAVGFNPTSVMRNANIIIGYVSGGTPQIRDDWGNSNTSHVSDLSLGGSSNVTLISGTEAAGSTIMQFSIPLNSTDQYDRALAIGQSYPIILARGANGADNYTGMHAGADVAQISLIGPVSSDDPLAPAQSGLSAYPNPFRGFTTLKYRLDGGPAVLSVYNTRGQLVRREQIESSGGTGEMAWNPVGLADGIYLLKLQSPTGVATGKIGRAHV